MNNLIPTDKIKEQWDGFTRVYRSDFTLKEYRALSTELKKNGFARFPTKGNYNGFGTSWFYFDKYDRNGNRISRILFDVFG